jgi:hypothetical protein
VNNLHSEMMYAMGLPEWASITQRLPRGSLDQRDLKPVSVFNGCQVVTACSDNQFQYLIQRAKTGAYLLH